MPSRLISERLLVRAQAEQAGRGFAQNEPGLSERRQAAPRRDARQDSRRRAGGQEQLAS